MKITTAVKHDRLTLLAKEGKATIRFTISRSGERISCAPELQAKAEQLWGWARETEGKHLTHGERLEQLAARARAEWGAA